MINKRLIGKNDDAENFILMTKFQFALIIPKMLIGGELEDVK